ncbi:hypothetical protein JR316_0002869 [Psilocybe cubensis]|uniref:Uncharacterized protein n=2 Tax=Psilocybe cubensis TaxID=181762 RepID=A0A8H7Y1C0_PSICU|nr:hypothetical protein JR316_0002869 [Psilocybe cubensis]KAH9483403.1 hypothetical protein JR316_0002869 [Psilocybe cubensis]
MNKSISLGIYTAVYGITVYIYLSKASSDVGHHRKIVLGGISALYWLTFLNSASMWNSLTWSLVLNGGNKNSMFWSSLLVPLWISALSSVIENIIFVISDALLIWRCYHVWGQSVRMIAVPLLLLFAELVLAFAATVLNILSTDLTNGKNMTLDDNILVALFFVSLATTSCATFLIGWRIYTASGHIGRSKYTHIITTIIESSAVYSLVLLVLAIHTVTRFSREIESPWFEMSAYTSLALNFVPGFAPTVMVLRLAIANTAKADFSSTITHICGIDSDGSQFQAESASASPESRTSAESGSMVDELNGDEDQGAIIDLIAESRREDLDSPISDYDHLLGIEFVVGQALAHHY